MHDGEARAALSGALRIDLVADVADDRVRYAGKPALGVKAASDANHAVCALARPHHTARLPAIWAGKERVGFGHDLPGFRHCARRALPLDRLIANKVRLRPTKDGLPRRGECELPRPRAKTKKARRPCGQRAWSVWSVLAGQYG